MSSQKTQSHHQNDELSKDKLIFYGLICIAIVMAYGAKSVAFNGMLMGTLSTIAVWVLVLKLPIKAKRWMSKHLLLSDLILSSISFIFLSSLEPGPTVFMAAITQAVLFSVLLYFLK